MEPTDLGFRILQLPVLFQLIDQILVTGTVCHVADLPKQSLSYSSLNYSWDTNEYWRKVSIKER